MKVAGEAKGGMPEPYRLDTTSVLHGVLVGRKQVDFHKPCAVVWHMHLTGQRHSLKRDTQIGNLECLRRKSGM